MSSLMSGMNESMYVFSVSSMMSEQSLVCEKHTYLSTWFFVYLVIEEDEEANG